MQQLDPHPGLCVRACVFACVPGPCAREVRQLIWPRVTYRERYSKRAVSRRRRIERPSLPPPPLPAQQDSLCYPLGQVCVKFPHSCTPFFFLSQRLKSRLRARRHPGGLVGPVRNVNAPRAERRLRYAHVARQKVPESILLNASPGTVSTERSERGS